MTSANARARAKARAEGLPPAEKPPVIADDAPTRQRARAKRRGHMKVLDAIAKRREKRQRKRERKS